MIKYNTEMVADVLLEYGLITPAQIKEARMHGGNKGVVDQLISKEYIDEEEIIKALAKHFSLECIDLSSAVIQKEALSLVPYDIAKRYHIIPIKISQDILTIAMSDPLRLMQLTRFLFV